MKERPILFSGAMVRALLGGSKTQTRRVIKQATGPSLSVGCEDGAATLSWLHGDGPGYPVQETTKLVTCPYGVPGDRLWVRESFWGCDGAGWGDTPCVVYDDEWHGQHYQAAEVRPWAPKFGRIPSIHMPRDCSRITLEVTGVRVERLQDINEVDAYAEGTFPGAYEYDNGEGTETARESYRCLWDSLNAARGYGWDTNPWVWVVEFKRIEVAA